MEQILDVRADPSAKTRLLNGLVNVALCPHCQGRGVLNVPFLYHDPDKDLALVYMPMEAGRSDVERQQAIGKLTSKAMESLPSEERGGYLLQPQVFLTMENLVNKVLEEEGVTPEMIEEQKAKADLLQRLAQAASDEVLEAMIKENDEAIDADLFRMLSMNLEMAQAMGGTAEMQQLLDLRSKLIELSSEGQAIRTRGELVEALRAEPSREKLLDLLIEAPDEAARQTLILSGRPLLDYPFFQALTARIEAAGDADEKERLTELRTEILDVRDQIDAEAQALLEERASLLRDLLLSDEPEQLARQRFVELDQAFLSVLASNLDEAEAEGDDETVEALESIWDLTLGLMEEALPPELRLFNRVLQAEDEEAVADLLAENRDLINERLVQLVEGSEAEARQEENLNVADRLALALEKMKELAPAEE